MNNIVSAKLDSRYASTLGVWQYDYGQVLRITGTELPPAVEVQFSLDEKSGETLSRVGTTVDGVTEVKIPDELLTHSATSNYRIYAYIYLTDETSGNTKYEITIPVRVRSKPTSPAEDPETDPDLFRETVVAVNASAERAKMAEQNAKESATEAGKYAASASESAVTAEKAKEDALRKVGEKKLEAIEAIQEQEETSVGNITTHTDGEIQRIQNQATDSKAGLEQTITNADTSKKELEHSIETAGTSKTALDKSVELAGTAKTELDTSIREAGTAKTALDESTETAGTVQETLSATVNQAVALDTSLGEEIETGTQLKTDLVASGEKAVQDIQAVGSEQLGKMQAVAEAFTADREQVATNKEDIGSLKEDTAVLQKRQNILVGSETGNPVSCNDVYSAPLCGLTVYGKSTQDGTPTPDAPVPIVSVGDGGSVAVKVMSRNILDMRKSNKSVNGAGITYTRNADYSFTRTGTATDKTGNLWLAGNFNIAPLTDGSNVFCTLKKGVKYSITGCVLLTKTQVGTIKSAKGKNFTPTEDMHITGVRNEEFDVGKTYNDIVYPAVYVEEKALQYEPYRKQLLTMPTPNGLPGIPVMSGGNYTDQNGQQWVCDAVDLERGVKVQRVDKTAFDSTKTLTEQNAILATPIETPLTPAEITAYKALTAYAPDTVVQASDGAGIKLDYQRDVNLVVKNLEDAIASMTTT